MSSLLKTSILIAALLAAVIAGSLYFSSSVKRPADGRDAGAGALPPVPLHAAVEDGLRALQDNRLDEARASFESVPESDPSHPIALRNLALVLVRAGDLQAAAEVLTRMVAADPDNAELHDQLAWLHYRNARYDLAELEALRALEIDPDQSGARYAAALFRVAQGRLGEAIGTYQRATEADGSREAVTRALQQLIELHEGRPDVVSVHYALAYFAHRLGRAELEVEELEHYLAAAPTGPLAERARQRLDEARAAAAPTR